MTTKDQLKWDRGIRSAVKYMSDIGWEVQFRVSKMSTCDIVKRIILVNSRHPSRVKYYVLLHEMGHAMDMSSVLYKSPTDLHGTKYNTLVYRIGRVKEEFEAWDRGQSIANANSWPMDDYFYVVRAKFISSYMIWAASRKIARAAEKEREEEIEDIEIEKMRTVRPPASVVMDLPPLPEEKPQQKD